MKVHLGGDNVYNKPWGGEADLSVDQYILWDDTNLYIAAVTKDDINQISGNNPGDAWTRDSIQLSFDSTRNAGYAGDNHIRLTGGLLENGGAGFFCETSLYNGKTVADLTLNFYRDEAAQTTYYLMALPWAALLPGGVAPTVGYTDIGYTLLINDLDGASGRGWIRYMDGIATGKDPSAFGDLIFADDIAGPGVGEPKALVSITGPDSVASGAGATVTYTVSATSMPPASGIELEFEVDGDYLSSKGFTALNGFTLLNAGNYGTPIYWKNIGNIWIGKATLLDLYSSGIGGDIDLLNLEFDVKEGVLGAAAIKLNYVIMSFTDGPVAVEILKDSATTQYTQYYSPYDLNKDGVVDLNDLTFALQYLLAEEGDANWGEAKAADVKADGKIDIDDLILILANYTIPYYS